MRTQGGTPNIINGVSRQPPEVRLTSQLEESVNQFPTVTRGLVPRNPTKLKGVINSPLPTEALTHLIDRDPTEQYVATISSNGVQVHRLDGTQMTVNAPDGYQYLAGANVEDLQALTVQDHTFILNKSRVVQKGNLRSNDLLPEGLVHIVQGDYFTKYEIKVNNTVVASVTTDGGPYEQQADARKAERGARPGVIARLLTHGNSGLDSIPNSASPHLTAALPGDEWTVTLYDNVIRIRNNWGRNFTLSAEAGSYTRMRAHKGQTADFSDLPTKGPNGFRIKVAGSDDTGYDDYWVRFTQETHDAEGVWKETIAPSHQYQIDAETMPHLLVREANGTFTFKKADWADREVGDEDTNPWPSFVGNRIEGMSFGNNRVGLHSGESIAQSRNGDFFNFWIESIIAPLDTDPIDLSISYPEVSTIHNVVPFSGEVILFTSSVPFRLAGGETMTQKNAHIEHLLSNTVSPKVRPVAAGSHLYFVNDTASGCFVHEFSYDRSVDNLTAQCITDHVAGYVPSGVIRMEADGDLKMLFLQSEHEPNTLYVYKWLWIGAEKAQSAWQKWVLPSPIMAMRFYGEELVIVTAPTGRREILTLNCHEAWLDGKPCPIYLDRQVGLTGTYSTATDLTTFTFPYNPAEAQIVLTSPDRFGELVSVVSRTATTVTAKGNLSGIAAVGGIPYRSFGVLSPLLHRSTNNQGAYGNALPGFRTTVAGIRFGSGDTAYLRVTLERDYRKPITYDLSAARVGTKTGTHGKLVLGDVDKNLSIMSKSTDFRLVIENIGPYPYSILSYQWSGDATPIAF